MLRLKPTTPHTALKKSRLRQGLVKMQNISHLGYLRSHESETPSLAVSKFVGFIYLDEFCDLSACHLTRIVA